MEFQNFDEIRPYNNHEVEEKMKLLLEDPVFDRVLMHIYPDEQKTNEVKYLLSTFKTIDDVQFKFIYELLKKVISTTTRGLSFDGLEHLEKDKPYLFISNHRDIIIDSALLNYLIYKNGMNTTQIAIGSNLLILDWIIHAVKLNRSFIINRDATSRELLTASLKVSDYIRKSITTDHVSIWIAQREGRTKDGSDKTQVSLLKMLNMSNKKSFIEGFAELNVVPVSISYEIEPCGIGKIRERMQKEVDESYIKKSKDDLKSMARGMFGQKGRIHFSFDEPINTELFKFRPDDRPNEMFQQLASLIDNHIHSHFKLWPNNYIACDWLTGESLYKNQYTDDDEKAFHNLILEAQSEIEGDKEDIRLRFLKLYANPVINAHS